MLICHTDNLIQVGPFGLIPVITDQASSGVQTCTETSLEGVQEVRGHSLLFVGQRAWQGKLNQGLHKLLKITEHEQTISFYTKK